MPTSIRSAFGTLLLALPLSAPSLAQQGGIEVFAGETLFEQGTRISLSHIHKRKGTLREGSNEISDPANQRWTEERLVMGLDYGIDRDLTLSALIPVVDRNLRNSGTNLSSTGLGDIARLAKYRVHRDEFPQGAFNVALAGGMELPTGSTNEQDGGMRLAPSLQPGAGAVNPFLSLGGTYSVGRARYDARTFYKVNLKGAQDYDPGEYLALGVSAAYRFLHEKYPGPSASAKLGLQWNHVGSDNQGGTSIANSGGEELLGRLGFGWHPVPQIDITFSIDVPLYQDLDGQQLGLDLRSFLAVGLRF